MGSFGSQIEGAVPHSRDSMAAGVLGGRAIASTARKQRESVLRSHSPFHSIQTPAHGMALPTFRVSDPGLLRLSGNALIHTPRGLFPW